MGSAVRIEELTKKFEENPRRYFAPLANEHRKAGNFAQAIELCRQYLADQPGHLSGHIVWGQSLIEAGRDDEAAQVFATAIGLDPQNLIALRHLGDLARKAGRPTMAVEWYRRILEADPHDAEIRALIAELAGEPVAEVAAPPPPAMPDTTLAAGIGVLDPQGDVPTLEWQVPPTTYETPPAVPAEGGELGAWSAAWTAAPAASAAGPPAGSGSAHEHDPFGFGQLDLPAAADVGAGTSGPATVDPLAGMMAALGPGGGASDDDSPLAGVHRASGGLDAGDHALAGLMTGASDPDASGMAYLGQLGEETPLTPEPPLPPPPPRAEFIPAEPENRTPPPAGASAPAAFVTATMAEVLERQGLDAEAAAVYRQLLEHQPGDVVVEARLATVEARLSAVLMPPALAGQSARAWLSRLGQAGPRATPEPPRPPEDAPLATPPARLAFPTPVVPQAAVAAAPDIPAATGGAERPVEVLSALFGAPSNAADEAAALALAALFDDAASPTGEASPALATEALPDAWPPAEASVAPAAASEEELLPAAPGGGIPPVPTPRATRSFSFDQFFATVPRHATPSSSSQADAEIAEFSRWLGDLKKQ